MEVFAKLIRTINHFFATLGNIISCCIIIAYILTISLFTPLFSKGVLFLLNHIPLPNSAYLNQPPTAIVVLGGGLTNNQLNEIIVSPSTKQRLLHTLKVYQRTKLPIIVSGKESPWMMTWLQLHGIMWVLPEKNSFNTCENAKFTAESIKVNNVILITDPYHMTRARRQFALNNIATLPSAAPLSHSTDWNNIDQNLKHSRRAIYELSALIRDIFLPQIDCKSQRYNFL